jgi:DNA invertase Pin-like site-specific DNA recombinase
MMRRCAVYTRKSSEEGLEQDFNSLHAQREACEAFIKSQKGEGWKLVPTAYDDGGLSGGNMDRPGLKQLLQDIRDRRIDVVVVYKVDRLTRSLADFAKMMEVFEASEVSFVSVTQQFNTTSSMGRLTLNILLSFAQFERELTGERIRDKISASKKKGIWMGGPLPLGYDVQDRKLIVNAAEAVQVRRIFDAYLEVGCVRKLQGVLETEGIRSKARPGMAHRLAGNRPFARGALYTILRNPIYLGEISHKGTVYPGQHHAIVERRIWDEVQQRLNESNGGRTAGVAAQAHLLAGRLWDEKGQPLITNHASKKGKRYRYYVSTSQEKGTPPKWRLPANQIESVIQAATIDLLKDETALARDMQTQGIELARTSSLLKHAKRACTQLEGDGNGLGELLHRVEVTSSQLRVSINLASGNEQPVLAERSIPMTMRRRGVETRLMLESGSRPAQVDETLIRAVARARNWFGEISEGRVRSHREIAAREGITAEYVNQLLPLAFLAPRIVEAIVSGRQAPHLSTRELMTRLQIPANWADQHRLLAIA